MIKIHRLTALVFAGFSLFATLAIFAASPQKVEAVSLTPGCWISEAPPGGSAPAWLSRDCAVFTKIWPNFKAESGKCYLSWSTAYGPSPAITAASCSDNSDISIPPPTAPVRYPVDNTPGNPPQLVIDLGVANCFEESGDTGYRQIDCAALGIPFEPGCHIITSVVGELGASVTGKKVECSTVQNVVTEGQLDPVAKEKLPEANADTCGDINIRQVKLSIDIGCQEKYNPIMDMLFAIVRFLSVGAGLVCIASAIAGAIQFTAAGGNPKATSAAIKRMASSVGALVFFLFIYAILNWLVPGGLFI